MLVDGVSMRFCVSLLLDLSSLCLLYFLMEWKIPVKGFDKCP